MRAGLPKANYLAFTGTPLLGKERKTNAWFGDYISEYNFQQSMDDGATVPLFYQKRVPGVQNQNENLSEEFYQILEDENLDDKQVSFCALNFPRQSAHPTLYLDKPMKDHTLMQTIARANRVTSWQMNGVSKRNGEIIDYYNVFRNMKRALKDYAQGQDDKPPVQEKDALFALLDDAIEQGLTFCREKEVRLDDVLAEQNVFDKLGSFTGFANTLLANDEWRKGFIVYQNTISSLYEACKPEVLIRNKGRVVAAFEYLRGVIDSIVQQADIDAVSQRISELLDESVVVDPAHDIAEEKAEYRIIHKGRTWDLSKIDFDKLKADFEDTGYKNIVIADLRAFVEQKLKLMLEQNVTRADFAQRLQEIIDRYNSGGSSTENYYDELLKFTRDMKDEEERHIREGLTEDELEMFDLLMKEGLTKDETQKVKLAAKSLLHRLLEEQPKVLVQDWFKDNQTQKIVRSAVEQVLDSNLPASYDRVLFRQKLDSVFGLMLDYASSGRKWAA